MTTFHAEGATDASGAVVVTASGDLDLASAEGFVGEVTTLVGEAAVVRLDLRDVTFMDSTGLGALIKVRNRMADRGGSVVLVSASAAVERVLALTGMSDVFNLA